MPGNVETLREARACLRKIHQELKYMEDWRDETGLVDGIVDLDFITNLAHKGYCKICRYLAEIDADDETD